MRNENASDGLIVLLSIDVPSGSRQRWPWTWKTCVSSPSASTSHCTLSPTRECSTGVLPTNARPLIVSKPRWDSKKVTNSRRARGPQLIGERLAGHHVAARAREARDERAVGAERVVHAVEVHGVRALERRVGVLEVDEDVVADPR